MELQHHGGSGPGTEMATESARGLPHAWEEGGMVGGGRKGGRECGVGERLGEEQGRDVEDGRREHHQSSALSSGRGSRRWRATCCPCGGVTMRLEGR
jgi:hypothetical protein